MNQQDGFHPDGPPHAASGGSRFARYWSGNAQNNQSSPSSNPLRNSGASSSVSLPGLNANVPSFVPSFAKLNLIEQGSADRSHSHSPFGHRPFGINNDVHEQTYEGLSSAPFFLPPQHGGRSSHVDSLLGHSEQSLADTHSVVTTNGCFGYAGPTPHIGKFRPKGPPGNPSLAQFMSPELKLELCQRQLAIEAKADPNVYPDLPLSVEHLRDLYPLEPLSGSRTSTMFKAISVRDGTPYAIRRIQNFRPSSPKQLQTSESWKKLQHINIVQLREVTQTRDFGGNDNSLLFVYDFHPLAQTLLQRHFGGAGGVLLDSISGAKLSQNTSNMSPQVTESVLWGYIVQLSSALRTIHASGLACRSVQLNKIIIQGRNKIMLSCCGVQDVLQPIASDGQPIQIQQFQAEDLMALGHVVLCLATGNHHAFRRDLIQNSFQYVSSHFSADMQNLIKYLLHPGQHNRRSINDIMPMVGARFYAQLESAQMRNDILENELSKELENGRLFRLLCKLNTIVERPECNGDPHWAENGDRFLIKLFRDYVFHQVMESGRPWMDMAHIVHTLNKLDAGIPENIELVSRDGEHVLIVSYLDLKRAVENAFRELVNPPMSNMQQIGRH